MKSTALIFLILFTLKASAQGVTVMRSAPEPSPSAPASPSTSSPSEHNEMPEPAPDPATMSAEDKDEAALNALQSAREERARTIEQVTEIAPKEIFDPISELKKLGHSEISVDSLLDEKVIPIFERMLKESNLKAQDPEVLKATITKQFQGHPVGNLFQRFPKCLTIFVEILRDDKAMPGLLRIMTLKHHLKKYFYVWLGLFIFTWWLKRKIIPKDAPFLSRTLRSIMVSLCFMSLTFFVFYQMFHKELSPTVSIIMREI
jgi:hypothetical protein